VIEKGTDILTTSSFEFQSISIEGKVFGKALKALMFMIGTLPSAIVGVACPPAEVPDGVTPSYTEIRISVV